MKNATWGAGVRGSRAALCLVSVMIAAAAHGEMIYVDFGPSNDDDGRAATSPDLYGNYWNSWRPVAGWETGCEPGCHVTVGTAINNLITRSNTATTIGMVVTENFTGANGINNGGLRSPNGPNRTLLSDFAVETATEDYFHDNIDGGGFKITNLNPTVTYNLFFFASRDATDTRTTRYQVSGGNVTSAVNLTTSGNNIGSNGSYDGNDDEIVAVYGVTPNGNNEIGVDVSSPLGASAFSYIGIMAIGTGSESPIITSPIPTLSEWGVIILAALVLGVAARKILRQRAPAAA